MRGPSKLALWRAANLVVLAHPWRCDCKARAALCAPPAELEPCLRCGVCLASCALLRWKIGKTLGQGSFATVKYAVDIKDGEGTEAASPATPTTQCFGLQTMRGGVVERQARLFLSQAVKIFDSVEDDVDLQEIEQEIMVMKDLKHKNCLQLCAPHQRPTAPTSSSLAPAPVGQYAVAVHYY